MNFVVSRLMKPFRRSPAGLIIIALGFSFSSCAETAATGEPVQIPRVVVNCTNSACSADHNPYVIAVITTGPCTNNFGFLRSSSEVVACNSTTGCRQELTRWIDDQGNSASTLPSGTYTVCAYVDHNNSADHPTTGDSLGQLENVAIGASTSVQEISTFQILN